MILGVNLGSFRALIRAEAQGRLTGDWLSREAEALLKLGTPHIELLTDGLFAFPDLFSEEAMGRLAALRRQVDFSVHLPYIFVDLASPNEPVRRASLHCIRQAIEVTERLAPVAYVIHLTSPRGDYIAPPNAPARERRLAYRLLREQAARTLHELGSYVQPEKVCVENLVESFPFDAIASLVEEFGLSFCFDVDHCVAQGGHWEASLESHLSRTREIHIHLQTCLACFKGGRESVDVPNLMAYLKAKDYTGTVVIEAGGQRRAIARAFDALRTLLGQ